MSEWTPSDIESARERTDPSLSDDTIIEILNKALRETGARRGVMFNHAIVRIYEQLRKEGQLKKMTQDRLKARSVSFMADDSLSHKLQIPIETVLTLTHEFGLDIPQDVLLDNEETIQTLITNLLFEIPHPISENGSLSLLAKRQLSRALQEWYQEYQKRPKDAVPHQTQASSEASPSTSPSSEPQDSLPSLPTIDQNGINNNQAISQKTPEKNHIQKTVDLGIQRILGQLVNLRFENNNFPYSALYIQLDKLLKDHDPCNFYSSFKAYSFFLNILEEGVMPLPGLQDDSEDFLIMLGFGRVSFIRRPETKAIEPHPIDIHLVVFSPDLKAQGLGIELLYSNKDILFDLYYKRLLKQEHEQVATEDREKLEAIATVLLNTKSGERYGKPKNMNEARSLALFLLNHLPDKELNALLKEAEAYGYNVAPEEHIRQEMIVDTTISTYMFPTPHPASELVGYLDFINRYGMDTKLVPQIRKLIREFSHIQNELNAYISEKGIMTIRNVFQKTSIAPIGKKGEIGILFLSEKYPYPLILSLTAENELHVHSPIIDLACRDKSTLPSRDMLARILSLFANPNQEKRRNIFNSPRMSAPFYKAYQHLKRERGYPIVNQVYELPINILDELADELERNPQLVNIPEENVHHLVKEYRAISLNIKLQCLLEKLRMYATAFTKPPDPMKNQFPYFNNFDAILPTQEAVNRISESVWENMKTL